MPTQQQMITAMITLQSLSNFYRPIYLFRYDDRSKIIFILAGEAENIEITIYANGERDYEVYE